MVGIPMASLALVGFLLVAPWPFWRLAASSPVRARPPRPGRPRRRPGRLRRRHRRTRGRLARRVAGHRGGRGGRRRRPVVAFAGRSWATRRDPAGPDPPPSARPVRRSRYLLDEAKRHGPIFKIGATFPVPTLTPIICVVGHDLGLELLRDHADALEVYPPFPASRFIPRSFLRNMNDRTTTGTRRSSGTPIPGAPIRRSSGRSSLRRGGSWPRMDAAGDGAAGRRPRPPFGASSSRSWRASTSDSRPGRPSSTDSRSGIGRWTSSASCGGCHSGPGSDGGSSLVDEVGRRFDGGPAGTAPCVVAAALESAGTADGAGEEPTSGRRSSATSCRCRSPAPRT